jgi:hypothetical protein
VALNFLELEEQILEMTCPLPGCEARDARFVNCLDEETGITEITGYCSHWTEFKKGDKWIL